MYITDIFYVYGIYGFYEEEWREIITFSYDPTFRHVHKFLCHESMLGVSFKVMVLIQDLLYSIHTFFIY